MKKLLLTLACLAGLVPCAQAVKPPAPCGATPTPQQVEWLRMEWYAFVHFGLNTFTGREWGYGDESPELFNPTNFNAGRIVSVFKEAGMTGLIYTAKHHDGWCSWPTRSTKHNITQSPWKKGKGNVVRAFAKACKKHNIKFGTYLSPWDRNCADYGKEGYLKVYYQQIKELLTDYGDIFEIWFDGAMGGDGYYGGARCKRNIGNADDYYNYKKVVKMIRKLQPDCIIWGAAQRGDVIWGGSEKGHVKYPCWNLVNKDTPNERWISLEGDTPINKAGWFWHPNQASKVKSPEHLMQVYLDSVGRGANLILNVAPNRQGELDPADVKSLLAFGEMRRKLLAKDYALEAPATASETRGDAKRFAANKVTDGDIESYWCPNDGTTTGTLEITLPQPTTFDVVRIREQIRLGQRVSGFHVEARINGTWQMIDNEGQTIGHQVLRKLATPVTADAVRLTITASRACPCISEISLLKMPGTEQEAATEEAPQSLPLEAVSGHGEAAIDGNPSTFWHAENTPAEFTVKLKQAQPISAFSYLPRQDGKVQNMTDRYILQGSLDGKEWKTLSEGEFSNLRANPIELTTQFDKPQNVQYLRFRATRALEGQGASVAEFRVFK